MKSKNSHKRMNRKGFALVLAIAAMAFMVLLTLTLSSVITSKLRLLTAQKEMRAARSNAILGLSVAISELQNKLGKDNAISFMSSILDENPDTIEIESVASPHVVGVIGVEKDNSRITPLDLLDEQRKLIEKIKKGGSDENVSWLVSGKKTMKNPKIENIEDLSDETVNLAEFKTLTAYPDSFGGQVSAQYKSQQVQVKAGKVQFSTKGDSNQDAAYAWWISDESLKAKMNLTRPEKYLDEKMGEINGKYAYADSKIPQVSNLSFVLELADFDSNPFVKGFKEETARIYRKMSSLDELSILDTTLQTWAKDNKGDWTASSVGIPVDVTQGRLKEDLTQYLTGGYGLRDADPVVRGFNTDKNYTGVDFGFNGKDALQARFGHMKTWYEFGKTLDSDKFNEGLDVVAPNMTSNSPQSGLSPVVCAVRYFFMPVYELAGAATSLYEFQGVNLRLSLAMTLRISLWNPHNVKLNATDYDIVLHLPMEFLTGSNPEGGHAGGSNSRANNLYRDRHFACTSWVRKVKGDDTSQTVRFRYTAKLPTNGTYFTSFLKNTADNGAPIMRFRVEKLELRPGESVQLIPKGNMPDYKVNGTNLLAPGKLENDTCTYVTSVSPGHFFKINLGLDGAVLTLKPDTIDKVPYAMGDALNALNPVSSAEINTLVQDGNVLKGMTEDNKEVTYTPFSAAGKVLKGVNYSEPVLQTLWITRQAEFKSLPRFYPKYGYELFANTRKYGWQRIEQTDLTEWQTLSTQSTTTNALSDNNGGLIYKEQQGFYWYTIRYFTQMVTGSNRFHNSSLRGGESYAINRLSDLAISNLKVGDMQSGLFHFYVGGNGATTMDATTAFSGFVREQGDSMTARAYRLTGMLVTENLPFTSENQRGSSIIDPNKTNMTKSDIRQAVIKRPETRKGNYRSYGSVKKFTGDRTIAAMLGSKDSGWNGGPGNDRILTGMFAWDPEIGRMDGMLSGKDDLMSAYSSGTSDGYSLRFGNTTFLSGAASYGWDHVISAPFEIPRSEFDVLSLGAFMNMNFTQFNWMPSWQLGESYPSVFMKREDVVESQYPALNDNCVELYDISYVLNASIWDRFYLSTMIPRHMPSTPAAGMRLPNTRYFLKSVPTDKSKLFGSDDAFKQSAAYVAVDGAFNINSTSYEAWRAFLGGMLGAQKKTVTGRYINEKGDNPNMPEKFKIPSPGSMTPLALPADEDENAGTTQPQGCYTYKDISVNRSVSEAEIDQLAREIVAEVKRRAPFFSLADFINRRLMKYSDANNLDLKYQSLMGTIAAAIKRSTQETNRPKEFFNSREFGEATGRSSSGSDNDTLIRDARDIVSFDGNSGNYKSLGERAREPGEEWLEHAALAPRESSIWTSRMDSAPGMLKQRDILNMIAPFITVRGDTFTVRAYGESKNPMTGTTSKAYCEAVVQRSSETVEGDDDIVAPESPFGRRFNIVSFRWLTPAEL